MKKHKWLKRIGLTLVSLAILFVGFLAYVNKQFGPDPFFPHKRITITLPYATEHEAEHLIPMGEEIAHPFPGGHPGIDFQWHKLPAPPLIAVADGTISFVGDYREVGGQTEELVLYMKSGEYEIRYKELSKIEEGIKKGSTVKKGQVIAYPACEGMGCQLHWEFTYGHWMFRFYGGKLINSKEEPTVDRLCPLTYFDEDARARIERLWDSVPESTDNFKQQYPHICSGVYHDRHQ